MTTHFVLNLWAACLMILIPVWAQAAPKIGDPAPPITVEALLNTPGGLDLSWEALGDKTVVLEFWGTWCGPCVAAIPHLNDLYEQLHPEGVEFLAVTYENAELIESFTEVRPMRSWIGCDTDRSMVEAYGVKSWPTTFIVRGGKVIQVTHPSQLTAESVRAIARGEGLPAMAISEEPVSSVAAVQPDGRPIITSGFQPGEDPYSLLDDVPAFQVIVRDAGEANFGGSSDHGATMIGYSLVNIVSNIWEIPPYAVSGDDWAKGKRLDVIWRIPVHENEEDLARWLARVQDLVANAAGFTVELKGQDVAGYELRVAESGLRLPSGVGSRQSGYSSQGSLDGSRQISGTNAPLAAVTGAIEDMLGQPVQDRTDLEELFFIDLKLPRGGATAIREALETQAGLTLRPAVFSVPAARVTRVSQ